MIKNTDKVEFILSYKKSGLFKSETFDSFAGAAGAASAMLDHTRMISVKAGDSKFSWSASLYMYSQGQSERKAMNEHAIKAVWEWSKK
jgi:hypothetical protein